MVAEGIETDETWAAVAATGCDLAQGYFIARPMDLSKLTVWLAEHPDDALSRSGTAGASV